MASRLREKYGKSPVWPALLSGLIAPGVGQLVNREYVKAGLLLFASIGSFIWFSRTVTTALQPLLPGTPDQWRADPAVFREAVTKVVSGNAEMFITFELLILVVWIFGIVDAYLTARKKSRPGQEPPIETGHP